jgi:phage anti-repressor protein
LGNRSDGFCSPNRASKDGEDSKFDFTQNGEKSNGRGGTRDGAGRAPVDYHLSLSMAKELCMVENNEKGREVRRYLIKVEEDWNSPEKILARAKLIEAGMQGYVTRQEAENLIRAASARHLEYIEDHIDIEDLAERVGDSLLSTYEKQMREVEDLMLEAFTITNRSKDRVNAWTLCQNHYKNEVKKPLPYESFCEAMCIIRPDLYLIKSNRVPTRIVGCYPKEGYGFMCGE